MASSFRSRMADPADLVEMVATFVQDSILAAVDKGADDITIETSSDLRFSARVGPRGDGFRITAFAGLGDTLISALSELAEGPLESLQELSQQLFGTAQEEDVIRGCMVSSALIFILLHEYAHIAAGHFHLRPATASPDQLFEFDEVADTFSYAGDNQGVPIDRLAELEADALAFNLLLDLSFPIFSAQEDVEKLLGGREPEGWRDRLIPPLVQMNFYAAALALALLDAYRAQERAGGSHPRPLARTLYLANLMIRRMTEGDWDSDKVEHRIKVNDSVHAQLRTFFLPTLFNGVEICEGALANLGLDLANRLGFRGGEPAWSRLADEYINLVKGAPKGFETEEGRELQDLSTRLPAFSALMAPHRIRQWWT